MSSVYEDITILSTSDSYPFLSNPLTSQHLVIKARFSFQSWQVASRRRHRTTTHRSASSDFP
eukprot:2715472-Amphidinium_carterae.2